MKKITIFLIISSFWINNYAQIADGTMPVSFGKQNLKSAIPVLSLSSFDVKQMLQEDEANNKANKSIPYRFAKRFKVSYTPQNAGVWDELANHDKIWRLKVRSNGAYSLNFIFGKYHLPDGVKLYLYNEDHSAILGALTSKNNKASGVLPTTLIPGDEVTIEMYVPFYVKKNNIDLQLTDIFHAYRNVVGWVNDTDNHLKDSQFGQSGSCNVDVACPQNAGWGDQTNAVARLVLGNALCSGALLNNTAQDGTPYLLTANHCIGEPYANWVFNFNYEVATCGSSTDPFPGSFNNSSMHSVSGCSFRATAGDGENGNPDTLDFCLVELSSLPPSSYNPYLAGWDHSGTIPDSTHGIHHPSGDVKKICIDQDPPTIDSYTGYDPNTHWHIAMWDVGVTEGGSSGSPLFDPNHRVIGNLTGGQAACGNTINDFYEMFSHSWADYPSQNRTQLQPWLDPSNSGVVTIDGMDPYNVSTVTANFTGTPLSIPVGATVTFTDQSLPSGTITSWDWNFDVTNVGGANPPSPATQNTQGPHVVTYNAPGLYTIRLIVSDGTNVDTLTRTDYVEVTATSLTANFSGTPLSVSVGGSVDFTDLTSGGTPTTWDWNFDVSGVGGANPPVPATSTTQNPSGVIYNAIGLYSVSLKVGDGTTTDSITKTDYIEVIDPNQLQIDFTGTPTTIIQGQTVDFTSTATNGGPATSWNWTFNGAVTTSSTVENPTGIQYNTPGVYSVFLEASDGAYTDTLTKVAYITVLDSTNATDADFTSNYTTILAGGSVDFTNLTTGLIDSVKWIFDGGVPATSTLMDPTGIIYGTIGDYDVTLIVYSSLGNDTAFKPAYIHVIDPSQMDSVHVDFKATTARLIVQGNTVNYEDLSTGYPTTFDWHFSGGIPATSTDQHPQGILYSTPGIYAVTLAASNAIDGDTLTKTNYIIVTSQPWPDPNGVCDTISNVQPSEIPLTFRHLTTNGQWGYFPGHNSLHITAYADRFVNYTFTGIRAIFVPVIKASAVSSGAKVRFSVWGEDSLGNIINTPLGYQDFPISTFTPNMFTSIEFDNVIPVHEKFYVGYQIYYGSPQDTFVVYMGPDRGQGGLNTLYCKKGGWKTASQALGDSINTSLGIKVIGCLVGNETIDLDRVISIYPNPAHDIVMIDFNDLYAADAVVDVFDMLGKKVNVKIVTDVNKIFMDMSNNDSGIYFVKISLGNSTITKKISLIR